MLLTTLNNHGLYHSFQQEIWTQLLAYEHFIGHWRCVVTTQPLSDCTSLICVSVLHSRRRLDWSCHGTRYVTFILVKQCWNYRAALLLIHIHIYQFNRLRGSEQKTVCHENWHECTPATAYCTAFSYHWWIYIQWARMHDAELQYDAQTQKPNVTTQVKISDVSEIKQQFWVTSTQPTYRQTARSLMPEPNTIRAEKILNLPHLSKDWVLHDVLHISHLM